MNFDKIIVCAFLLYLERIFFNMLEQLKFTFCSLCAFRGFLENSRIMGILVRNFERAKLPIPKIPTMRCALWGF